MNDSPLTPWIRPALLLWAAFMAFGIALVAGALDLALPGVGDRFGKVVMGTMGIAPAWLADTVQAMFGFYAIGKSGEKIAGHMALAKVPRPDPQPLDEPPGPDSRTTPDDPDQEQI